MLLCDLELVKRGTLTSHSLGGEAGIHQLVAQKWLIGDLPANLGSMAVRVTLL